MMTRTLALSLIVVAGLLAATSATDCKKAKTLSIWKDHTETCTTYDFEEYEYYIKIMDMAVAISDDLELQVTHPCGTETKKNTKKDLNIELSIMCSQPGDISVKVINRNKVTHARINIFFIVRQGKKWVPDDVPIIALPGVAGSMLRSVDEQTKSDTLFWVRFVGLADTVLERSLGRFNTTTERFTGFQDDRYTIYAPQKEHGLYAIRNLSPSVPFEAATYWKAFIEFLEGMGYEAGRNLFGYPYDWRQSNRYLPDLEKLKDVILNAYKNSGNNRVAILTHSMGCLKARSFLAEFPEFSEKYVQKWITIGCPWQGAPGPTSYGMIGGYDFGMPDLLFPTDVAHQVQIGVPSLYEMLPNPNFQWSPQPLVKIRSGGKDVKSFDTKTVNDLYTEVNKDNVQQQHGVTYHIPFDQNLVDYTEETRKKWDSLKLPPTIDLYNVVGSGWKTNFHATYETDTPDDLRSILGAQPYRPQWDYDKDAGDGTVSIQSATARGVYRLTDEVTIDNEHFKLIVDERVMNHVTDFLRRSPTVEPFDAKPRCSAAEKFSQESSQWSLHGLYVEMIIGGVAAAFVVVAVVAGIKMRRSKTQRDALLADYEPLQ